MVVIGLEIHCQLLTQTKLFCSCPNIFTHEPNTNVCETCLGLPGSKPRLNKKAVEHAIKIGIALKCTLNKEMFFSRKSYFYPDMSKNFQITQYEVPVCHSGKVEINGNKIKIKRIQIEEDPARLTHQGSIESAKQVLVDYNRSGTPLVEIVTDPNFKNPKEARIFLQELSLMMEYLGVYDSSIEGSMRIDANISLPKGERVEIKNISGFKEVEKALSYEIIRQESLIKRNQKIKRETRGWNQQSTFSMRSKEEEEDYGYIYETDLPVVTTSQLATMLRDDIPEFAKEKAIRYEKDLGIGKELALSIVSDPEIAEAFEYSIAEIDSQTASMFFSKMLKKVLNYQNLRLSKTGIKIEWLIKLMKKMKSDELTDRAAELLLRDIIVKPQDPDEILKTKGLTRISDPDELGPIIDIVLARDTIPIMDYKRGQKESLEYLVGQVMRETKGRADPHVTRSLILKKIEN